AADAVVTLKLDALDVVPPGVVTEIGPLVPAAGTVAVTCVSERTLNDAAVPLNTTDVAPVNPEPLIVTLAPTGPLAGVKLLIAGAATTLEPQPGSVNDPIRVSQASSA